MPRDELKATLIKGLRQEHKYRHKRTNKTSETRGKIADMLSIEERPEDVADRTVPEHWERDHILAKYKQTALGTLGERTTHFKMLIPPKAKGAETVSKACANKAFTISTDMNVDFAHPASPRERGTNENTNSLIRQYFLKGTAFDEITPKLIKLVQDRLNGRPRHVLNYLTINEAFTALVALNP